MFLSKTLGVLGLLFIGCQNCEARELATSEKQLIMDAMTKDFKDPEAAQFKWLPITDQDKNGSVASNVYCGLVNGKNSYGGYTGFVPFAAFLVARDGKIIVAGPLGVGSSQSAHVAIVKTCAENGIDPSKAK